jgi:hypothetical protein
MEQKEDKKQVARRRTRTVDALRDATLLLLLIGQGEKDLQEGRFLSQAEAFTRVRSHLP